MAKQDLSRYQDKIVKRYYDNQDTIQSQKIAELVSELWLAEDEKTLTKLWNKAGMALKRLGVEGPKIARVVEARDLKALAKLAAAADAGKVAQAGRSPRPAPGTARPAPGGEAPHATSPGPGTVDRHRGTLPSDGSAIKAMGARSAADQPGGARTISQMRAEKASASGYDSLESDNLKRAMKSFRRKLKNYRRDDESKLGAKYTTSGKVSSISGVAPPSEFPPAVWDKLVEEGRLKKGGGGTLELP